ncbi:hypothetical protein DFH07DRAFT_124539 [Mycena maculata]|uniref:Uncharacterized protein n=1 Tax=Mycena maculata TaxID=230809 RepID=A0AAD7JY93_9AGAR|nr:hypothetical protein DFH07DRAFT_124539 [Mycena maculata]
MFRVVPPPEEEQPQNRPRIDSRIDQNSHLMVSEARIAPRIDAESNPESGRSKFDSILTRFCLRIELESNRESSKNRRTLTSPNITPISTGHLVSKAEQADDNLIMSILSRIPGNSRQRIFGPPAVLPISHLGDLILELSFKVEFRHYAGKAPKMRGISKTSIFGRKDCTISSLQVWEALILYLAWWIVTSSLDVSSLSILTMCCSTTNGQHNFPCWYVD